MIARYRYEATKANTIACMPTLSASNTTKEADFS